MENITYGIPHTTVRDVENAVDQAQCRQIIDSLPLGIHTKIGTEGTCLSGGEQQRIAFAGAILKNAPIIVLDEATAFADPENEYCIYQALHQLMKNKTVLMIAHRLSSITDVDNILVIDKGQIIEQGSHAQLLQQKGIYLKRRNEYRQAVNRTIGKEVSHIRQRFALSHKGAIDFCKGTLFTILRDLTLMTPAVFVFPFLDDYLQPILNPDTPVAHGFGYYSLLALAFMAVIYVATVLQTRTTYTAVYNESATRRISLAEKLRKLPLAFFGEKNLSDLTATMMDDCIDLERTFSHAVPQLIASVVRIILVATGLAFYNWQLTLALF
jgi:ABC-type multidrug transport system fused ATPase/permease subunit